MLFLPAPHKDAVDGSARFKRLRNGIAPCYDISFSLVFHMNKPIPFRGFRTRLRPKFAILSQYIVDYSILIFAIATETRNLARFLQAVFTPKTAVFLGSFFAALFSSF